jgi:inosine-uridine nucleoside N-ribohydrolase
MPLEVCDQISHSIPFQEFRLDVLSKNGNEIIQFLDKVEVLRFKKYRESNFTRWRCCDLNSALCFIFPDAIKKTLKFHATVELAGNYTRGQMVLDHLKKEASNIEIIQEIDVEKLKKFCLWICGHEKEFNF